MGAATLSPCAGLALSFPVEAVAKGQFHPLSSFPRKRESTSVTSKRPSLDSRFRGNDDPFATASVDRRERKPRGFSLFVAMIFLLVLSLLAAVTMRSVIMHERMAGNTQDWNLAFQAAEAALRDGQTDAANRAANFDYNLLSSYTAGSCGSGHDGVCKPSEDGIPIWKHLDTDDPCWRTGIDTGCGVSQRYGLYTGEDRLKNLNNIDSSTPLAAQPRYVIENLGSADPSCGLTPCIYSEDHTFKYAYRVTAVGFGNILTPDPAGSGRSIPAIRVVLQAAVKNN